MLARVAASLLVAPLPAATVAALPTSHAATVVAVDVDTDGDGLPDAGDGCPTVASTNPTGCPTASRQARLKWMEGRNRLQTRITSPVQSCASHARINLWRVRPHRDFKVLQVDASARGRYRFRVARGPRYFVTVSPSYSPGEAECAKAVSRKVRVPRA
jgi:hypothetical protein